MEEREQRLVPVQEEEVVVVEVVGSRSSGGCSLFH